MGPTNQRIFEVGCRVPQVRAPILGANLGERNELSYFSFPASPISDNYSLARSFGEL